MDLPTFDWSVLGTFAGGAATAVFTRFLGIAQKVAAMERRIDLQAENHANLTSELAATRERLTATDKELQRVTRLLMTSRRANRELSARVRQLEQERDQALAKVADTDARAKLLIEQWEADKARPSHQTMPPPGGRAR